MSNLITNMVKPTLICAGLLASISTTEAAILFFDDEAEYQTALDNNSKDTTTLDRPFSAEYMATASPYFGTQPTANEGRSSLIAFSNEPTSTNGVSNLAWTIVARQDKAKLVWQDNEFDNPSTHGPIISIGDVNNYENDDFSIRFGFSIKPGEYHIAGFSGYLYGNSEESGEGFTVGSYREGFGSSSTSFTAAQYDLGSSDLNGFQFFGVIATEEKEILQQITFNEGSGGDDIGVAGFQFAVAQNASVPEPSSTALLGLGALGLLARRHRKTA